MSEDEVSILGLVGESVVVKKEAESEGGEGASGYGAQELKVSKVSDEIPSGIVAETGCGLRVELGQAPNQANDVETPRGNIISQEVLPPPRSLGNNENLVRPVMDNVNGVAPSEPGGNIVGNEATIHMHGVLASRGTGGGGAGSGEGSFLYVGDLHWWTADVEFEAEICKYGAVKEVKFFDEKASGKSKGYCQVEFYDPMAVAACKEGMNGYAFNVDLDFTSPHSVKRMGEAHLNRSQHAQYVLAQANKGDPADFPIKPVATTNNNNNANGGNFQGGEKRGFGRGNWVRGNAQGMGGRGPGGQMRNKPGGRGFMGNGGGGFGQGMGTGPPMRSLQQTQGRT